VGANELLLIIDSGMKSFPARLFWQPIFYPVLSLSYAVEIAEGWNMRDPESDGVGFVTTLNYPEIIFKSFPCVLSGLIITRNFGFRQKNSMSSIE